MHIDPPSLPLLPSLSYMEEVLFLIEKSLLLIEGRCEVLTDGLDDLKLGLELCHGLVARIKFLLFLFKQRREVIIESGQRVNTYKHERSQS